VSRPMATSATVSVHRKRENCRGCGGRNLTRFLSLGPTALANSFLRSPEEFRDEARFPLDVYFCRDCSLTQLLDVIHPEVLFRHYIYVTGTSDTIARHNREYARTIAGLLHLSSSDLVIEVASNDGSLLTCFRDLGIRTLGIEPASNIAEIARSRGIETMNEFFCSAMARKVRETYGPARAVIANNVLAHVDEPCDFLSGARTLIGEEGLIITEFPYAGEFLDRLEYDTVYHEHLCYFSVTPILRMFERAGLAILRIDSVAVHGGSLRVYAGQWERNGRHAESVQAMAREECSRGLTGFARYEEFGEKTAANRQAIRDLLCRLKSEGRSVAGYGAPAKGNTLLNYCGIDTSLVPYTVDKNPLKVGTYTPGTHIPVLPVETLLERQPDYVLILAWNFAGEIMEQQREYHRRGGRFIIPIPAPRVV